MALQWQQVGTLKGADGADGAQGPKGDQGEKGDTGATGASIRTATSTITASSDVSTGIITPNTNIQVGDMILDTTGALYAIESIGDGTVHVGTALAVNLKGPQGDQGIQGPAGADGTSVTIKGSVEDAGSLPQEGNTEGDGYLVDGDLYIWNGSSWQNVGQIQGPQGDKGEKGDPGTAATVTIGSTQTSEPGGQAQVTNGGDDTAAVLNFTIPRGEQGPKGDTGATGIQFGTGAPSGTAAEGSGYVDISTWNVYVYEEE